MDSEDIRRPKCSAKTKNCRNCGYRFPAGSDELACPECGEDRSCKNYALPGCSVCRMHGGKGGRPPSQKYILPSQIQRTYNRILQSGKMVDLSHEIAIIGSRIEQLMKLLDEFDSQINAQRARDAVEQMEGALLSGNRSTQFAALDQLRSALSPMEATNLIWHQLNDQIEIARKTILSQHKILHENRQMVTMEEVVELLVYFQRIVFRYITNPADRKALSLELRERGFGPPKRE